MTIRDANTTLLEASKNPASDKTPAQLAQSSNEITFAFNKVQPPSILYIDEDDALVIQAASSVSPEIVTVNVRLLQANGRLEDNQFQIRPAGNRTVLRTNFVLTQGYLLSVSATAALAATRGMTFCRIYLQRGASGTGQPGQVLFSDYVTTQIAPAYPNGRSLAPTDGPGLIYTVTVTNPGAGLDWSTIVPVNARWRVRSFNAVLTTSGTAANRQVSSFLTATGIAFFNGPAIANILASTAAQVSGASITPYVSVWATEFLVPLPTDLMLTGSSLIPQAIGVLTNNLQVGDVWSSIRLHVEEWLDNV